MAYCGTALVNYLSQVEYDELTGFDAEADLHSFVEETLIPSAERTIDNFVGRRDGTLRHFNPHYSASILLDGNGKNTLWLPPKYCPPIDIGTVNINGVEVFARSASSDAIKLHEQYLDYDGGRFTEGKLNVELVGTYGYNAVPADVELICGQLVANVLLDARRRRWASMAWLRWEQFPYRSPPPSLVTPMCSRTI